MGILNWTPSIIPKIDDQDVYLVDDLGSYGEVWREVETVATDVELSEPGRGNPVLLKSRAYLYTLTRLAKFAN